MKLEKSRILLAEAEIAFMDYKQARQKLRDGQEFDLIENKILLQSKKKTKSYEKNVEDPKEF